MASSYEQLVKALRCKALSKQCDSCKYGYRLCPDSECNDACNVEQIYADAAAAIEALKNALADECAECDYLVNENARLTTENKELQAEVEKKRTADCFGCKCEKVEPKRGEWIYSGGQDDRRNYYCHCSVCGAGDIHAIKGTVPYCWRCGAKMEVQDG